MANEGAQAVGSSPQELADMFKREVSNVSRSRARTSRIAMKATVA